MTEYTVTINNVKYNVLATSRIDAVQRALCYGSDASEFITNIFE
jgi:hypothetical protein